MSIQLTVMSLDFESSAAPFTKVFDKDEITLGRLPGNDLVLDKPEISGYHASLRVKAGDDGKIIFVKDLGSSNGTMVENSPLRAQSEVTVEPNQRIIIGNYLIKPSLVESRSDDTAEEVSNVTAISEAMSESSSALSATATEEVGYAELSERKTGNGSSISFAQMFRDAPESSSETNDSNPKAGNEELRVVEDETDSPSARDSGPSGEDAQETFTITVKVGDANLENVNFVAQLLLGLSGRVEHKGVPLAGVTVRDANLGTVVTDADGAFSFDSIVESTAYSLSFEKEGYEIAPITGQVEESAPALSAAACKLVAIRGCITRGDKPLAGVRVDGGEALGSCETDQDGNYCFENVREDAEYTLRVSKPNFLVKRA